MEETVSEDTMGTAPIGGEKRASPATITESLAGNISDDDAGKLVSLTAQDKDILEFEREWWKFAGTKEIAIKETFNISATRYYQLLNILIDNNKALEFDPMLIKRLRRLRASRQRARAARALGINAH